MAAMLGCPKADGGDGFTGGTVMSTAVAGELRALRVGEELHDRSADAVIFTL